MTSKVMMIGSTFMGNNFNEARSTVLILFNVEKIILNYLRSLYGSILDF